MTFRAELVAEPWRFDLLSVLQATRARESAEAAHRRRAQRSPTNIVAIGENPYFEFPDSTIEAASIDPTGLVRLKTRFLGMFGPQGALPLTTTEEAYSWLRERDDAFPRFVDIFQRRFLELFFRAWADAHPVAQNDRPDEDRFRAYIGSMIGIGTPAYRNADSISDFAKLQYAGLLAPRVKSASRLRSFLSSFFETRVEIEEFVGAWLAFDPGERTQLGAANSRLGVDCIAGASMYGVSDKFRVRVYVRDIEHFRAVSAGLAARAGNRRRDFPLRRGRIRLGYGARDPRRRDHTGSPGAERAARLDELDGAELGQDRRDDPHATRGSMSSAASPQAARGRRRTSQGKDHGRRHQRRGSRRQAQPGRLRGLHSRVCGRPRPPATAISSSATGSFNSCRRTGPTSP